MLEIRGDEIWYNREHVATLKEGLAPTLISRLDEYIMSLSNDSDEYKRGYSDGCDDTKDNRGDYDDGYNEGLNVGEQNVSDESYEDGYNQAKIEFDTIKAHTEGLKQGYDKGYDDGWAGKEYNSGLDENRTINNQESTE
jgi:hypothetical protein